MNTETTKDIFGGCYCGSVRFAIEAGTKPLLAGYCHCKDCRQAHAAPLYQYVYVEESCFKITSGVDVLQSYTRDPSAQKHFKRFFCSRCGSKIYNRMIQRKEQSDLVLFGTFPSLFDDQKIATNKVWSATKHVFCEQSIMNLELIKDSLPRF